MNWQDQVNGNPIPWLLEKESPGVRYLALRDLLEAPADDTEFIEARKAAHRVGPIASILAKMDVEGYWAEPGAGYSPKYKATGWSVQLLAQLGAAVTEDERIQTACNYLIEHSLTPGGQFTYRGQPSGTLDCLQGNLCWAIRELGCEDERLGSAFEWMARTVTGEGIAPAKSRETAIHYYKYKCGPNFACGANSQMPCAWGATKVMLAFSSLPKEMRTPLIDEAIRTGIDFFFSTDPAKADYPSGVNDKPSRNWWKFGFPVFYITDLLQVVETLASLGYGKDARLKNAVSIILEKQDPKGRWPLEYDYKGKTWGTYGKINEPNKWVTIRALRVLKRISENAG